MSITSVKLFSIPVSNQDQAREFYVDKVGFELKNDRLMDPQRRWIEVGPKGAKTSITLVTWFGDMTAGSVKGVVLQSDDLEEDVSMLRQKGIQFEGETQYKTEGLFVTFKDPDGNGLILQQPAFFA